MTLVIIANVLFTMITKTHLRSGVDIIAQKEGQETNVTNISASRGTIYDRNGEVIAKDETTYNIVLYLNESRIVGKDTPAHIVDTNKTARLLSEKLGMDQQAIIDYIENGKNAGSYQVELGTKGKNLSPSVKESIEALALPGVEFTQSVKRNYPNSYFSSNLLGYAQYDEELKKIVGKMGLEETLNDQLTGTDGKTISQKDKNGNTLPGTTYVEKYVHNGNNVVLTLDQNVQLALENLTKKAMSYAGNPEKAWALAVEVETGKILGWTSYPSFNLNTRDDITNYLDIPSDFAYEPGSVLKGMTYAAALQEGKYPYNNKLVALGAFYYNYSNGEIVRVSKDQAVDVMNPVRDSVLREGESVNYDKGFAISSNIVISDMLTSCINTDTYVEYLHKFGFLKSINMPYVTNAAGSIDTSSALSSLAVGFGQSINVTALQMVQAYTAILNDGKLMQPYVVEKIEDSTTREAIEKYEPTVLGTPISKETSDYMKKLMHMVVEEGGTAFGRYNMDDVDILAKTGTGEVSTQTGYRDGFWTNSVIAAAPADDPKVMLYFAFQASTFNDFTGNDFKEAMRELLIAQGITSEAASGNNQKETNDYAEYTMPALTNHTMDYAKHKLQDMKVNTIVVGNGSSVVSQFPAQGEAIVSNQFVFLLTDGEKITMPNMNGWTMKDVTAFWKLTGIQIQMEGSGSVYEQNIAPDKAISTDTDITVKLK